MKAIPTDLSPQVLRSAIDIPATTRLAEIYHRSLARTLFRAAGAPAQDLSGVSHLPPEAVQQAYDPPAGLTVDAVARLVTADRASRAAAPYDGPVDAPWVVSGLQAVLRSLGWDEPDAGTVLASDEDLRRSFRLASQALAAVWPQAWEEFNLLVDHVVFVEGPVRSATVQSSFGAVWAERTEAIDPELMFELILHESGHHSLALREQFTTFLENPSELATHRLRPDPRPLRGVLHAAFVSDRMWRGVELYRTRYGVSGPLEGADLEARTAFVADAYEAAIETLERHARWTADGRALFESLKERA